MKNARNTSKLESKDIKSKNGMLKVLYTRVSSLDQKSDRQNINKEDYDWLFEDKISGSIEFFKRPKGAELKKMIDDGIVASVDIWSIDRAGRNLLDILQTLKYCAIKKVQINFISQGLRTLDDDEKENPIAKMVISILGVVAEMQREQIREAQAQGIALAKAKGVYEGRKQNTKETVFKFLSKPKSKRILELLDKKYKGSEIAKILGVSQTTVSKVKKLNNN